MDLGFLLPWYPWVKSLHLIAVFAWMAGLFYLPRLYVYHTQVAAGSPQSALFKVMERRLLRAIMNPAMIAAWLFGLTLVLTPGVVDWKAGWWHGKLTGLIGMTLFHHVVSAGRKAFAEDRNRRSERYWRIANEVPTLLLILIVIMVIVKPF
ncbi:protoporphyrinogen oxidase HemJ [Roseomonas sp. GC11]|uniref:protoporphyrinogen oxidase HemJ n=1 Tax=Roseomonas sp. GC11 TaxID=2950546 RepID=UPI002108FDE3|nr:protoporphyrinogen oxidase HemJ [Roseomonas sp. GC11]MCQ4162184.1 protoporphyrinogen oxidase HemJ [Roseomonas sp. GC11]